ncbi:hypothetical protein J6590_010354 [Homalodisca vitripennis]|nr:hypothetical protein J6590_010354 [Homalodisca vitripennis]
MSDIWYPQKGKAGIPSPLYPFLSLPNTGLWMPKENKLLIHDEHTAIKTVVNALLWDLPGPISKTTAVPLPALPRWVTDLRRPRVKAHAASPILGK